MPSIELMSIDVWSLGLAKEIGATPADWPQVRKTAHAQVLICDALNELVEQCAAAAEAQDRTGYEWVANSLWANILRRAGANVRALSTKQLNTIDRPEGER